MPTLEQIVDGIPINQKAPANSTIKNYLIKMLEEIHQNRKVIEQEQIRLKAQNVINDYKSHVGFQKLLNKVIKSRKELENATMELIKVGLGEHGTLLTVHTKDRMGNAGFWIDHDGEWTRIDETVAKRIMEVHELIHAVESERNVFSPFHQLKARLMMSSSVGECAAIINAAAGQPIFKIKPSTLALKDKE